MHLVVNLLPTASTQLLLLSHTDLANNQRRT